MGDPIEAQRAWLQGVLAIKGWSGTHLAREAGVAQTTITRLLNNREPVHPLNATSLAKVERAAGIPFGAREPQPGFSEEATPFNAPASDPLSQMIAKAAAGSNGIDPWIMKSRALDTAGVLPDDILVVDLNAVPAPGDIVCAQIYDWSGRGNTRTVFRLYEPPFLVGQSTIETLRKPFLVDNEKVVLKGVVAATIRPRTRRSQAA